MAQVQRTGRTEIVVPVAIDDVWSVVCDPTRTGEWSHECVDVRWLGGATVAAPGVRFRGRNRAGWVRWGRLCEVTAVEPPHELAWRVVPTALFPDSTLWRLRLDAVAGGTRIVQEFAVVRGAPLLEPLYVRLVPTHQDRTAALAADLQRLGEVARTSGSSQHAAPSAPDLP